MLFWWFVQITNRLTPAIALNWQVMDWQWTIAEYKVVTTYQKKSKKGQPGNLWTVHWQQGSMICMRLQLNTHCSKRWKPETLENWTRLNDMEWFDVRQKEHLWDILYNNPNGGSTLQCAKINDLLQEFCCLTPQDTFRDTVDFKTQPPGPLHLTCSQLQHETVLVLKLYCQYHCYMYKYWVKVRK